MITSNLWDYPTIKIINNRSHPNLGGINQIAPRELVYLFRATVEAFERE